MTRSTWNSRLGFIFAAAGSAVGLANIWRFPFVVGDNGGAVFILVYLLCLIFIGFPVFMAEVLVGRATQGNPATAFHKLGKTKMWKWLGKGVILTGFIVSAFYSAVAGWVAGYLGEAFLGRLSNFTTPGQVAEHHEALLANPIWGLSVHFLFLALCTWVLFSGVKRGIERSNRILMPMLYVILGVLLVRGLTLPGALDGLSFLLSPDWNELTPQLFLIALGQSFFTLSIGQGTMITYGSYLDKKENVLTSCIPVVLLDTVVSLVSAVVVFTIVFSVGMTPDSGPSLLFQTLPLVFSQLPAGGLLAILFFLLVFFAAVTSEISAMEPLVAYIVDEWKWSRKWAVMLTSFGVFLVGIPCALSTSLLKDWTLFGWTPLELMIFIGSSILIPLGGFFAVILVGWVWGVNKSLKEMKEGAGSTFERYPKLPGYFALCFRYTAPILIAIILMNALGIFTWHA